MYKFLDFKQAFERSILSNRSYLYNKKEELKKYEDNWYDLEYFFKEICNPKNCGRVKSGHLRSSKFDNEFLHFYAYGNSVDNLSLSALIFYDYYVYRSVVYNICQEFDEAMKIFNREHQYIFNGYNLFYLNKCIDIFYKAIAYSFDIKQEKINDEISMEIKLEGNSANIIFYKDNIVFKRKITFSRGWDASEIKEMIKIHYD